LSQAQLETKMADYLRKSQALEHYWQRPITPEHLLDAARAYSFATRFIPSLSGVTKAMS
jgi:hypothetical protein